MSGPGGLHRPLEAARRRDAVAPPPRLDRLVEAACACACDDGGVLRWLCERRRRERADGRRERDRSPRGVRSVGRAGPSSGGGPYHGRRATASRRCGTPVSQALAPAPRACTLARVPPDSTAVRPRFVSSPRFPRGTRVAHGRRHANAPLPLTLVALAGCASGPDDDPTSTSAVARAAERAGAPVASATRTPARSKPGSRVNLGPTTRGQFGVATGDRALPKGGGGRLRRR